MSGPHVVVTLPSGSIFTQYYTEIDALTDAQGDPTNAITPNEGTVTVSGITDAGPPTGSTIQVFLFGYEVDAGLPEETDIAAQTAKVSATDLHETDSQGNELYSWSASLSTTGLAPGLYALQSFSYVPGYVETNGVPVALSAYEEDEATVTVSEFVPFTYVVRADTEVVSVGAAQSDTLVSLPNANSSVQLSADGRYVVWTSGDQYEEDLQTGATIDLTTTGRAAPVLQTTLAPTFTAVGHPDPYGPEDNGGYTARNYPTFTEGGVTFGTAPDFDFNPNDGSENPLPTVTDANGDTEVLAPFGVAKTMSGYAAAASDNGNAVLTVQPYDVSYFSPYSSNGISEDPQYNVVYRSPAPTLTLDPVNGNNEFSPGASAVTLTGTSNAIGQVVEIDFGQAGAEVGTATVQSNGRWSYTFDASSITGSSLFIEASVMSAAGTPASVSETATISAQPPATITHIFGSDEENTATFGPGETLTIYVSTSAPVTVSGTPELTLSNGEVATYSYGSGFSQLEFTYVPAITDTGSSDLTITGLNLPAGASITDANGNELAGSFDQALGLTLQTVPVIESLYPVGTSSDFVTNSATPYITVSAEEGETITVYDNGTVVGTGTTPYLGTQGITEVTITPTTALPEGQSTLTASATDSTGRSSALSSPVTITVDTIPPAETITGLAVDGNNDVTIAAQAGLAITVTGTLSAPLQAGESVVIVLPNGQTATVTPASGATSFSFSPTAAEAASFGAGGSISAYVMDAAGNTGASTNQSFTADSLRLITPVSADPADLSQTSGMAPALSADGTTVAFEAAPGSGLDDVVRADDAGDITAGIYVETLATGAVTLAVADGEDPTLSGDGTILAYDEQGASGLQVYTEDLTTGAVTLVSAADGVVADDESFDPSISADGTKIAFLSYAGNLVAGVSSSGDGPQLYVATLSAGAVTGITAVSVAADGTSGNGSIEAAALSGDGSEVVFSSTDTNLLASGDPHTPNLSTSTGQIYVRALANNAASGLTAGEVVLVSGNADGTVGNTTSNAAKLSANGRYVVFTSEATNLAPSNLASGATLPTGGGVEQVYVKDLLTGTVSLVSQTAAGVVGDGYAQDASISSDGTTVVFSDTADNFGAGAVGEQLYAASLSNGVVTRLTLLSEPGAIPGDGPSTAASLSADGATVVFQSASDNLVSGTGQGYQAYETSTGQSTAPPTTDVFEENEAATSGPYSGSYLWSNAANWSQGVPTAGGSVLMAAVGVDDIAGLSLASLNLSPPTGTDGELLEEAGLTVGTLTIAAASRIDLLDGSGAPDTLTITGSIAAPQDADVPPTIDADGQGAVVDDQEATTPEVEYIAQDGAVVELAGAVSATTLLSYGGGTFALAAPGATIAAELANVAVGDVLELPGHMVQSATFGTDSLTITTDEGTVDFTNVTFDGVVNSYTTMPDDATGLEAITFTGPDIFEGNEAATSGFYLWSNAANWSQGVPTSGNSVEMAGVSEDDIANLSLTSLSVSPLPGDTGVDGQLFIDDDLTVYSLTVAASSEIDVVGGAQPTMLTVNGPATIDGRILTDPSTITFEGAVTGSGTIEIGADSDVTFDGPVAATVTVDFLSNTGTLTIGDPSQFAAQIIGSGTEVVICYLRGTRVLTPGGEVPIETLIRGDRLVTRFGGVQAIKWIGRQSFAARFLAKNPAHWPVCIAAGALGPAQPARDLHVSPGHSMLIADRLILARNLVNGVTITQSEPTDDIHYYQVEFDSQDCILAEGAWSESYADDEGLRNQFHNVAEFWALFPDYTSPSEPALCAPRPESGPDLEAALQPIVARAGAGLTPGPLRGWIDTIDLGRITGWAQDMAHPEMPVLLDIWLRDRRLGTVLACDFREDLEAAGIGRGRCSFSFAASIDIPAGSTRHLIISRSADGAALPMTDALQALLPDQPFPDTRELGAPDIESGSARGPLRGWIDIVEADRITGWVQDPEYPHSPVSLLVTVDDRLVERAVANSHRPDVEQAGIGDGRYGFSVVFNPPLPPGRPWLIRVRSEADGQDMPGSPVRIPASDEFDGQVSTALVAAPGSAVTEAELDDRIGFLPEERERLLQMRADLQPGLTHAPARSSQGPTDARLSGRKGRRQKTAIGIRTAKARH